MPKIIQTTECVCIANCSVLYTFKYPAFKSITKSIAKEKIKIDFYIFAPFSQKISYK